MENNTTPLQKERANYQTTIPVCLRRLETLKAAEGKHLELKNNPNALRGLFPRTFNQPLIHFRETSEKQEHRPINIGVVLSGGQAAGGHNVITGLYDAMKKLHPDSKLFGFLDGPAGIIQNRYKELDEEFLSHYRNQGGFDMIGAGRDKIEKLKDFTAAEETVKTHSLDGIVIIGGDDSSTDCKLGNDG